MSKDNETAKDNEKTKNNDKNKNTKLSKNRNKDENRTSKMRCYRGCCGRTKRCCVFMFKVLLWCLAIYVCLRIYRAIFHVHISYHSMTHQDQKEIAYKYLYSELSPRAAMVCPSGFTITKLKYQFGNASQGMSQPNISPIGFIQYDDEDSSLADYHVIMLSEEEFTHMIEYEKLNRDDYATGNTTEAIFMPQNGASGRNQIWAGRNHELGPCPTLTYCIGHQACLFHYSNKFCQNDPNPGQRKQLDIRIYCNRDNVFETYISDYMDFQEHKPSGDRLLANVAQEKAHDIINAVKSYPKTTTFIKYEGVLDGTKSGLIPPIQVMISEEEVFNATCPLPKDIHSAGYRGHCKPMLRDKRQISDDLWSRLGRESCPECRRQLLETYCAYLYNPRGDCIPPYNLDESKNIESASRIGWSSVAMPENGERFNLSNYYQVLKDPNIDLIAARLAFFIMAHESAPAIIQLLEQIYNPNNYYVIILDSQAQKARQEMQRLLKKTFVGVSNIRVLPQERSFPSSWGSWIIQRAQLECYEELLRMGVWDFAVYLSGRDLPTRNMDDLAIMLAPYRGNSLVRINGKLNPAMDPPASTVWQSCNRHVYNLTIRAPQPGLEIWSHTNFGIYSRDYVEFILSSKRGHEIDQVQFYIQTSFIPDELYMGTLLHHSSYKDTSINTGLHFTKPFAGEDSDNLCRHQEETDSCGRGPPDFQMEDVPLLTSVRHNFFFSRKYSTEAEDPTRLEVIQLTTNSSYYDEINKLLPPALQMRLAEKAIMQLTGKSSLKDVDKIAITKTQVVPKLKQANPCCVFRTPMPENPLTEYRLILHFDVTLTQGKPSKAVANIDLKPDWSHSCYPGGHIQALYVTTREAVNPMNNFQRRPPNAENKRNEMRERMKKMPGYENMPEDMRKRMENDYMERMGIENNREDPRQEAEQNNMPNAEHEETKPMLSPVLNSLPTVVHPFGGQVLYLDFILSSSLSDECKAIGTNEGIFSNRYINFNFPYNLMPQMGPPQQPDPNALKKYDVEVDIAITDSLGEVIYDESHALSKGMLGERNPQGPNAIEQDSTKLRIQLNGRYFKEGKYTVTVKRKGDTSEVVYKQSFITINENNTESYLTDEVLDYFDITHVAWHDDLNSAKYYVNVPVKDEKKHNALIRVPLRDRLDKIPEVNTEQPQMKLKSVAAEFAEYQRPSKAWKYFLGVEYFFIIVIIAGAFFIYRYRVKLITTGKGREKGGKQATQLTTITRKQAFKYFIFTAFVYHLLVFIYYVATSEAESMFEVAEIAHDEM